MNDEGFSLLEALIAMAILAGVVSAAMLLGRSTLRLQDRAVEDMRAALAAEMLLARIGLDIPLQAQASAGQFQDRSAWTIDIAPHLAEGQEPPSRPLFKVRVTVTPDSRSAVADLQSFVLEAPR